MSDWQSLLNCNVLYKQSLTSIDTFFQSKPKGNDAMKEELSQTAVSA